MPIGLRRLVARKARVPEGLAVLGPGQASPGGRILHLGDDRLDLPAARHVIDVQRAVLAAVQGERHRELRAVRRRAEPVDRHGAVGGQGVGIEQHPAARRIGLGVHHDQLRLLQGRIVIIGEDLSARRGEAGDGRRSRLGQSRQLRLHALAPGDGVEIGARAPVLGVAPGLHFRIRRVLEPAVGIGDFHAMEGVDDLNRPGSAAPGRRASPHKPASATWRRGRRPEGPIS